MGLVTPDFTAWLLMLLVFAICFWGVARLLRRRVTPNRVRYISALLVALFITTVLFFAFLLIAGTMAFDG